jgi:hypothetical protein
MTDPNPFADVAVLLPARLHEARDTIAQALRSELAAWIAMAPTGSPSPAPGALEDADPEQFKAWAASLIRALPTRSKGEAHGNR